MSVKPVKAFLSYSSHDEATVAEVALGLDAGGIYTFFAAVDLLPGSNLIDWMSTNIHDSTHFVLFWSANARRSVWVAKEWQAALHQQVLGKKVVVPVVLDSTPLPSLLANIVYVDARHDPENAVKTLCRVMVPTAPHRALRRADMRALTGYDLQRETMQRTAEKALKAKGDLAMGIIDIRLPVSEEGVLLQVLRSLPIHVFRLERKSREKVGGERHRWYALHALTSRSWLDHVEKTLRSHGMVVIHKGVMSR